MFGASSFELNRQNGYEFLRITNGTLPDRTLVFLHGMFGGLSNFDPLLKRLKGETVLVPSIPIYEKDGLSAPTIPAIADWLHGFVSDNGLDRLVLLGNSMGGHIALEYAHKHPERLEGLVLTGSSGLFENDFGTSVPRRNDRDYIRERACMTFYDDAIVTDEIVDELFEVIQAPSKLSRLLRVARSTHAHNMEHILPTLDIPALLVWGRDDEITPPEVAEMFFELLPDARLKWIDKCGHAPMMEHPDLFYSHLNDFLKHLDKTNINSRRLQDYEENYSH